METVGVEDQRGARGIFWGRTGFSVGVAELDDDPELLEVDTFEILRVPSLERHG